MSMNNGPDAAEFYRMIANKPPSPLFLDALSYATQTVDRLALDLGCGTGRDTKGLLAKGFQVAAVDIDSKAEPYITKLAPPDRVRFVCSSFDQFQFEKYDFINAQRCLSFNHPSTFDQVMRSIKSALKPNGIFTGDFFGARDGWNIPSSNKTFLTDEQAKAWFKDMDILYFEEFEEDGTLADGSPKHWHRFDFIVRQLAR